MDELERSFQDQIDKRLDSLQELENENIINDRLYKVETQENFKQLSLNVVSSVTLSSVDPIQLALEREALIAFYESTNGDNWRINSGWKDDNGEFTDDLSNWYGITLDQNGYVSEIDLGPHNTNFDNNLTGVLPPQIGDLIHLTSLILPYNKITGSIPYEFYNLVELRIIDLSGNKFEGVLPPQIGNLINLEKLILRSNSGLTGDIPIEVYGLTSLRELLLYGNTWTGNIPSEVGDLINLEKLYIGSTYISSTIPDEIANLDSLTDLYLYGHISGDLPSNITQLTKLEYLYIVGEMTGTIPHDIVKLKNLEYLYLSGELTGGISSDFQFLTKLQYLILKDNLLDGNIPNIFDSLKSLRTLDLRGNQLDGIIPTSITSLKILDRLDLGGNQLEGSIPSNIGELGFLTYLSLSGNLLEGPIPKSIGDLIYLQYFYVSNNQLYDSIPSSIGDLIRLKSLYLSYNKFSGNIPSSIGKLINLIVCQMQYNEFSGSIPKEFGNLNKLSSLYLNDNKLSGTIPAELGNLKTQMVSLANNSLFGDLPTEISSQYYQLSIVGNKFTFSNFISTNISRISNFWFSPQDTIDDEKNFEVMIGDSLVLSTDIDRNTDPPCQYQWFRDGVAVTTLSEENHTFTISSLTGDDIGDYHYIIKNYDPYVSKLTLYSRIQKVINRCPSVINDFSYEPFVCTNYFLPISEADSCQEISYTWDFGDGVTSDERDPYHAYSSPGTYDVSFIIEFFCDSLCGGIQYDTITKQIVVPELSLDLVETNIDVPSQHITEVLSASASTFADTWPIIQMESILENKSPYQNGTMGVWRNDASYVYNIDRSFTAPVNIQDDGTFGLNTFNWEYADLDAIPNWLKANTITNYSDFSFELENQDILGNYTSAIYGYDGQLPSATGQNMQYEEMAFSGFEDVDGRTAGNWRLVTAAQPRKVLYQVYSGKGAVAIVQTDMASLSLDNSWMVATRTSGLGRRLNLRRCEIVCMEQFDENPEWTVVLFDQNLSERPWEGIIWNVYGGITQERPDLDGTVAHTGDASLRISADITHEQDQLKLIPGEEYLVSSWVSVNDQHLTEPVLADNIGLTITIKDENDAVVTSYDFLPEGPIIEGWQKLNGSFLYPLAAAKFELTLKAGSKGTAWYDDLRLHPLDGNMQTYVYEAETLRLKAVLDENNYASLYYYDQEGKLRIVKKETEKGIKTISESADHLVQYQE